MCILLLVRFFLKRSFTHLSIAITSAKNTVERLPIGMLSLYSYEGPYIPAPKQFCIPDPSVNLHSYKKWAKL
jgi:hypothetical protein